MYFGIALTGNATQYFLPSILKQLGWTALKAQYMSIPIWLVTWATSIVVGYLSDRFQIRSAFLVGSLSVSMVGLSLLLAQQHITVGVRYMSLFLVTIGIFSSLGMSVTWMNNNIVGKKRRGISTAICLAIGNSGGLVGSNVYLSSQAPRYPVGYGVSLGGVFLAAGSALALVVCLWRENKAKDRGDRDHLLSLPANEQAALADQHPSYRYTC